MLGFKLPHERTDVFELCSCLHCNPPEWYWKDKINISMEEMKRRANHFTWERLFRFLETKYAAPVGLTGD